MAGLPVYFSPPGGRAPRLLRTLEAFHPPLRSLLLESVSSARWCLQELMVFTLYHLHWEDFCRSRITAESAGQADRIALPSRWDYSMRVSV